MLLTLGNCRRFRCSAALGITTVPVGGRAGAAGLFAGRAGSGWQPGRRATSRDDAAGRRRDAPLGARRRARGGHGGSPGSAPTGCGSPPAGRALAPARTARTRPGPPFDPSDSRTYPREPWIRLDRAVKAAKSAGLDVMLDVAFWAPRWAVTAGGQAGRPADAGRRTRRSSASFAGAVARRYDGSFPDPERPGEALPDVRMYTTWNEPNDADVPAPAVDPPPRALAGRVAAHLPGDAQRGLRRDQGPVGAQPRAHGRRRRPTGSPRPGTWRGGATALPARARLRRRPAGPAGHSRVPRLPAAARRRLVPSSVLARDHPGRHRTPTPTTRRWPTPGASRACSGPSPTAAGWRGASRCTRPNTATRRTRPTRRRTTGRWSRPASSAGPPTWRGATPAHGCSPSFCCATSIRATARRPGTRWSEFQTGLFFADGTPKPAAQAFRMPFWAQVQDAGGQQSVLLFGGVRPARGPVVLRVERRGGEADAWHPIEVTGERCDSNGPAFIADPSGWFLRAAPVHGPRGIPPEPPAPGAASWESGIALPVAAGSALR